MRKAMLLPVTAALAMCIAVSGCSVKNNTAGKVVPEPSETAAVEASPEPTPVPTAAPDPEIDICGETVRESELKSGYSFELFGQEVNTAETTKIEYLKTEISDEGLDVFREVLPYMYNLRYLSFDRCGTTDEAVAQLRAEFPDVKIVWRVFFGPFSCMTDVEKIWASCDLYDGMTEPLMYCNDVKYLDVGHGPLTDYSFLQYMPELEVLIISCGDVEDCSPIGEYCHNLVYLEAAETRISDVSPIANCTTLEYLNIGGNQNLNIDSLRKLYSLPNLKRFYCENIYRYGSATMAAEGEKVKELMPDCDVAFEWNGDTSLGGKWRYTRGLYDGGFNDMYLKLRDVFEYDDPQGSTRLYE